ncbi:PREDICTED: uncharacterized protein LOC106811613 isoform X2 [Priapulus caudatus]|uniref:Protection of telomeres protein 1 n=1 Tax=Priapulus caudatus TaxID=37621 RepID=A0ABM1EF30_PRICU|nr:PREDICTED: uncharacterized protein LOC106811613 isoform X2 [Priapulus caudatus]
MKIVRVVLKSSAGINDYTINGDGSETLEQLIPNGALHTTIKDLKRGLSKRYIKGKISWKGSLTAVGDNQISLKITDDNVCWKKKQHSPQTARGSQGKAPKDMVVLIDFSGSVALWVDQVTQLWDTVAVCNAMTRQCEDHQDMGVNQWKLEFVPAVSSQSRSSSYFFVDTRRKRLTGNVASMSLKVMGTQTPMEASAPEQSTTANNSNTAIASGASCTGGRFNKRKLDFTSTSQSKSKRHEQTGGTVFTKPAEKDDGVEKIRGSTAIQEILAALSISLNLGERNSIPSGEISMSQQGGTNTDQTVGIVTPEIMKSSFWENSKDLSNNLMANRESGCLEVNSDLSEAMPTRVESALRESSVSSSDSSTTEQSSNPIWLIGSPPVMDVTAGVISGMQRCNNTTLIKDLAVGSIASVWGIVKFLDEPKKTRGTDWMLNFGLVDGSTGEEEGDAVHCHVFAPTKQLLPQIYRRRDIVLLLHAKVTLFYGKLQLRETAATVALVFDEEPASSEQPRTGSADLLYSFTELDREQLSHYRELFKQTKSFAPVTTKKSLISDIKLNSYSDVYCQIVTVNVVHPDTMIVLNIWNGTELNRSLRVRGSAEEQARLTCESLQVTLPVHVTGSQAAIIASKLQVGDHVWLRNLHCLKASEVHQNIASGFTVVDLLMAHGSTIDREVVPLARISKEVQSLNMSLMNLHDEPEPVIASHPCGPLQESFNAEARVEREMSSTHQAEHGNIPAAAMPSRSLLVTCQVTSIREITEEDIGYTRITGSSDLARHSSSDVGVTHPPFRNVCGSLPITLHLMPCDTTNVQQLKL